MSCANHAGIAETAYCRTCGKPLCVNCARPVLGVVYCETCLAERMKGTAPPTTAPYVLAAGPAYASPGVPPAGGGPNPALAGILAGFFPFGVGAVYCAQYAKGLAHLLIFGLLIFGVSHGHGFEPLFGMGVAFFVIYQIVDAVRSAKALQAGQAPPDPFGLAQTFSTGERMDMSRVPTGAVVLIGLGVLFLIHSLGFAEFDMDHFWPFILIGVGVWLFAKRWGVIGVSNACGCERCRARCSMGPAVLVTLGVLFLLESFSGRAGFDHTWPVLLLVIGGVKLWQGQASNAGHVQALPPAGPGLTPPPVAPQPQAAVEPQPASSEVDHV